MFERITEIIGTFSPAALMYVWWAQKNIRDLKKSREFWRAEAEKNQERFIAAMERLAHHDINIDDLRPTVPNHPLGKISA